MEFTNEINSHLSKANNTNTHITEILSYDLCPVDSGVSTLTGTVQVRIVSRLLSDHRL
jgi:hypothetical protein